MLILWGCPLIRLQECPWFLCHESATYGLGACAAPFGTIASRTSVTPCADMGIFDLPHIDFLQQPFGPVTLFGFGIIAFSYSAPLQSGFFTTSTYNFDTAFYALLVVHLGAFLTCCYEFGSRSQMHFEPGVRRRLLRDRIYGE